MFPFLHDFSAFFSFFDDSHCVDCEILVWSQYTTGPEPDSEILAVNLIGPGIMGSIVLGALCVGTQPGNSCVRWIFSLAVRHTASRPISKGQL